MSELQTLKCSGATAIDGGNYSEVRNSGSLKVRQNLHCESLHSSGATKIAGTVDCSGQVSCSGVLAIGENLTAGSLHTSGSVKVEGKLRCGGEVKSSGSLHSADLEADSVKCSGAIQCSALRAASVSTSGRLEAQSVAAEHFRSSGKLEIEGLLNAEQIEINVCSSSEVTDIGGSTIRVFQEKGGFSLTKPYLHVKSIEGDTVELEGTKAEVVRGRFVRIGKDCEIGRVEYTEDLAMEGGVVQMQAKL